MQKNLAVMKKKLLKKTKFRGFNTQELLDHLKYALLQPEKGKPIIISAGLARLEEQKLVETLKKYKEAIA